MTEPRPRAQEILVERMRTRCCDRWLDLIITVYPEALDFVLKDCRDVIPKVSILALYMPQGAELPKTDHPIALDVPGTLEIALKLFARAKRVYVVSGAHDVDRSKVDRTLRNLKKWEGRLKFLHLSHMPFEEILAALSSALAKSMILFLACSQDVTGKSDTTPSVAQQLSRVSKAPMFVPEWKSGRCDWAPLLICESPLMKKP
jgi:hypothetical protein